MCYDPCPLVQSYICLLTLLFYIQYTKLQNVNNKCPPLLNDCWDKFERHKIPGAPAELLCGQLFSVIRMWFDCVKLTTRCIRQCWKEEKNIQPKTLLSLGHRFVTTYTQDFIKNIFKRCIPDHSCHDRERKVPFWRSCWQACNPNSTCPGCSHTSTNNIEVKRLELALWLHLKTKNQFWFLW